MTKNPISGKQVLGKPVILCILDGWGIGKSSPNNGITQAHTPVWDRLLATHPHTQLTASEEAVGLPHGQMGNSEVGHMTIGSGRVVFQELPRIDQSILSGELEQLPAFTDFCAKMDRVDGVCHVLGLLSPGGVHSHQDHMLKLAEALARRKFSVVVHAFLDGRDTPPQSAVHYLKDFLEAIHKNPYITLGTMGGRYFGMDRDKRWDRVQKAYKAMAYGVGEVVQDPVSYLGTAYELSLSDEFIEPVCLTGYHGMREGDGLVMSNFRADRARQILTAFLDPQFDGFPRTRQIKFAATLGMSEYSDALNPLIPALFPKDALQCTLGEVISQKGLKQFRISETEKYAHVTFFFNGGKEALFPGEDRQLVPSPSVATYDLKPEMSADVVTDSLVSAIESGAYSLLVVNFANPDMVGHTGIPPAIIKAVETIDGCLGRLDAAARACGYALIVTADHGNVEQMVDEETGEPHTAHTLNPVPFLLAGDLPEGSLQKDRAGGLCDIAPTILSLMEIEQPAEMTGCSLWKKEKTA